MHFQCDISGCWNALESGFQIYIRNLIDSLIKISAYENNLETLNDFQVNDEPLVREKAFFSGEGMFGNGVFEIKI